MVTDATRDDDSFVIPVQPQHSIARRPDLSPVAFLMRRSFSGGGSESGSATKEDHSQLFPVVMERSPWR